MLTTAIATPRPGPERGVRKVRIRELRSPSSALPEDAQAAAGRQGQRFWICLIVPFAQRRFSARFTHRRSELPFSKTMPEALSSSSVREAADDHAIIELHARHVERRREVDDDAVDLTVLQSLHGEVVRVV